MQAPVSAACGLGEAVQAPLGQLQRLRAGDLLRGRSPALAAATPLALHMRTSELAAVGLALHTGVLSNPDLRKQDEPTHYYESEGVAASGHWDQLCGIQSGVQGPSMGLVKAASDKYLTTSI